MAGSSWLIRRQRSALLLIDFQEKLAAVVQRRTTVEANLVRLARAADLLGVPVVLTEQYPKGLGPTTRALAACVRHPLEKLAFGCCAEKSVLERLRSIDANQWILAGIETHVCVAQTALQMLEGQLPHVEAVFVVADACSSRRELDHAIALDRLRQAGVGVVTTESVLFEWLERAGTDSFKAVARLVRTADEELLRETG